MARVQDPNTGEIINLPDWVEQGNIDPSQWQSWGQTAMNTPAYSAFQNMPPTPSFTQTNPQGLNQDPRQTVGGPIEPPPPPPKQPEYQQYSGPMSPDYGFLNDAPPQWNWQYPGGEFKYDSYQAPSYADAENDPGYQFGLQQGNQAIKQSAAMMGKLRTGGTIKDLINYNRGAAGQQYGAVNDRQFSAWNANRNNAFQNYTTNYGNARQNAWDAYEPTLEDWRTKRDLSGHAADESFNRAWDAFTYGQPSATTIFNAGANG
jgi:hypothetical protein